MADRRSAATSLPTAAAPPVSLLGLYQVLLGLALLITPHWFNNPVYESWGGQYGPIGLAFLLAGAGLLWVALLPVRRTAVVLAAYLLAMVNFGSMALMFGRSGAVQASAVYGVLALGTLLLGGLNLGRGWFSSAACRTFRPQGTVVHVIALVTGALLLWRPGAGGEPLYAPLAARFPLFGAAFLILGGSLLLWNVRPVARWRWAAALANVILAGFLAWWAFGFVSSEGWIGFLTYALLSLGLLAAVLPEHFPGQQTVRGALGNPLRRRVALTVITILVGAAVVLALALTANTASSDRATAEAHAEVLAIAVADQLSYFLETHQAILHQIADFPAVRNGEVDRMTEALRETQKDFPSFNAIVVVDDAGMQIARSTPGPLVDLSERPHVQRALAGEENVFGGATASLTTGRPIVVLGMPVRDPETNEVRGAVSASIELTQLSDFLVSMPAARGWDLFVLAADGQVVAHSNPDLPLTGEMLPATARDAILRGAAPGSTQYVNAGERYLAGHAPVSPYAWDVIVAEPEASALASVWAMEDRAYIVLVLGSLLLAVLGAYLVDRLFRPLAALLEPLRSLGEGRYEVALPAAADGPVGDLVGAVERMRRDLREREAALAASEASYRSLVEHLPAVVYQLAPDEAETPLYFSSFYPRLTGYSLAEGLARHDHWLADVHPDDQARVAAEDRRSMATGDVFRAEYRRRRKDGAYIWVQDECAPVRDASGTIISWQGVLLDVTARKRVEAELAAERETLNTLVETLPDAVYVKDTGSRFVRLNTHTAEVLGVADPSEAVGKTDFDFFPDKLAQQYFANEQQVIASGEPLLNQLEPQGDAEDAAWWLTSTVPRRDATGNVIGIVGVGRDITQRRHDEAQLREALQAAESGIRAKTLFLGMMSHELRTPLQAILGYADLLLTDTTAPLTEVQREDLGYIRNGAVRMVEMIDQLLDLSRMGAGRLELACTPVDLAEISERVRQDIAPQAAAKGLELRIVMPPALPAALGDADRLRQVLLNLVGNAVKFTEAGAIEIAATATAGGVAVTVRDTGIGIDAAALPHVFEEFRQVDSRTSRRYGGAGLGLAIARGLTEEMGGTISVVSEPGAGSVFTLHLQRGEAERGAERVAPVAL